jgi:DNA-binding transcriptional MerR regulator
MTVEGSATNGKKAGAMLAIGEVATRVGVPTHILRYWETRFPQLRPLQRSGRRRYYRAEDVALVERIHHLLNGEGFTVEGARKALAGDGGDAQLAMVHVHEGIGIGELKALRQRLVRALDA